MRPKFAAELSEFSLFRNSALETEFRPLLRLLRTFEGFQGSANGGFQKVVRVFWGNEIPLPPFYLSLTSFLPQFYLNLTSFLPFLTSI